MYLHTLVVIENLHNMNRIKYLFIYCTYLHTLVVIENLHNMNRINIYSIYLRIYIH